MRVYLAGIDTYTPERTYPLVRNRLDTFAYSVEALRYVRHAPPRPHVLIDSGAFTAYMTSGTPVNVRDYAAFATAYQHAHGSTLSSLRFINLDVIPGQRGQRVTRAQAAEASEASLRNADHLRSCGLDVMEVMHQSDPWPFLDTLLDRLPDGAVLCLSVDKGVATSRQADAWLAAVLAHLLRRYGRAQLPRVHGLGITSRARLLAFPWYSVDSSSWVSVLRYGRTRDTPLAHLPRPGEHKMANALALRHEVRKYERMEADATAAWRERGVEWDD